MSGKQITERSTEICIPFFIQMQPLHSAGIVTFLNQNHMEIFAFSGASSFAVKVYFRVPLTALGDT